MVNKFKLKAVVSIAMAVIVGSSFFYGADFEAQEILTKEVVSENKTADGGCEYCDGTNINSNAYTYWGRVVNSYLTAVDENMFMRVEYIDETDSTQIEYYDEHYNLLSSNMLRKQLPVFGGFYETAENYFIVTGQTNNNEDDSVEVFRITKYDKNWNEIKSCSLYGANTTVPFDAGSLRMTDNGKYLFIRTCHEMYKSSDGRNHQANVTIQVDMDKMEITDYLTEVANSTVGYVSHSFNQFIKFDDNKLVALDHGDAYPRSICLMKYNKDISDGTFLGNVYPACESINVLSFEGDIGDNYTGASVGGFEISDKAYLIAGNNTESYKGNNATRNVFVGAVSKETEEVSMNYITNYTGSPMALTPHLVDLKNGKFMLLWDEQGEESAEDAVCYTLIDENGQQISDIYKMNSALSSCKPIVNNGKVIWYTWYAENTYFNEISIDDLEKTSIITVTNGHKYENEKIESYSLIKICKRCGAAKEFNLMSSFEAGWTPDKETYAYFYTSSNKYKVDDFAVGNKIYYKIFDKSQKAADEYNIKAEISSPDMAEIVYDGKDEGYLVLKKEGTFEVTFYTELKPEVKQTYTIIAGEENTNNPNDTYEPGDTDSSKDTYEPDDTDNPSDTDDTQGSGNTDLPDNSDIEQEYKYGDVDYNKKIDLLDAKIVLKVSLGIISADVTTLKEADVNLDGKINLLDAKIVLKMALGIK